MSTAKTTVRALQTRGMGSGVSPMPPLLWLHFLSALTRFCGALWVERMTPGERIFWDRGIWQ